MPAAAASALAHGSLLLTVAADGSRLGVGFANAGETEVRIWSRGCALGWNSLTLLLARTPDADDPQRLSPPPRNWTRDGPRPLPIPPGGRVNLVSWPGEPAWEGVEGLARWRDRPLALRAELRIEPSAEACAEGVASGLLCSPPAWSPSPHGWLFGDAPAF